MPESDVLAKKEREKFERKQKARMKNKTPEDNGTNWRLDKYFEECR